VVLLDGPCGEPSIDLGRTKRLLIITGGIGITPALSLLTNLCATYGEKKDDKIAIEHVTLVWVSRDENTVSCFRQAILSVYRLIWYQEGSHVPYPRRSPQGVLHLRVVRGSSPYHLLPLRPTLWLASHRLGSRRRSISHPKSIHLLLMSRAWNYQPVVVVPLNPLVVELRPSPSSGAADQSSQKPLMSSSPHLLHLPWKVGCSPVGLHHYSMMLRGNHSVFRCLSTRKNSHGDLWSEGISGLIGEEEEEVLIEEGEDGRRVERRTAGLAGILFAPFLLDGD